jgi:hypothetical protein
MTVPSFNHGTDTAVHRTYACLSPAILDTPYPPCDDIVELRRSRAVETIGEVILALSQVTYHSDTGGGTAGYTVGWFSLALINGGLAQGKNRSGLNWFLLSLLLGPVATLLLVAFFPKLYEYEE